MADKEFTYAEVAEHNTKKDVYLVIHDKIYNASSFVDEHPYVAPSTACRSSSWTHLPSALRGSPSHAQFSYLL